MTGLREVVLAGKVEEFYSPLLGGGRWQASRFRTLRSIFNKVHQIKFISSTDRKVSAVFMEKRIQGEALSSTGARLGDYDIMLTVNIFLATNLENDSTVKYPLAADPVPH